MKFWFKAVTPALRLTRIRSCIVRPKGSTRQVQQDGQSPTAISLIVAWYGEWVNRVDKPIPESLTLDTMPFLSGTTFTYADISGSGFKAIPGLSIKTFWIQQT